MKILRQPLDKDDHILGDSGAPCILVEYGDYESSRCLYARHVVKELQHQFGSDLSFVFRHFPVVSASPYAEMAAETSEFAAGQGMFWQMHDLLYQSQERNGVPTFQELAQILGLDGSALLHDLELQTFVQRVLTDVHGGKRSGVTTAPAFFINGKRYGRQIDFKDMSAVIRSAISTYQQE